jgi:hypothetical protein
MSPHQIQLYAALYMHIKYIDFTHSWHKVYTTKTCTARMHAFTGNVLCM